MVSTRNGTGPSSKHRLWNGTPYSRRQRTRLITICSEHIFHSCFINQYVWVDLVSYYTNQGFWPGVKPSQDRAEKNPGLASLRRTEPNFLWHLGKQILPGSCLSRVLRSGVGAHSPIDGHFTCYVELPEGSWQTVSRHDSQLDISEIWCIRVKNIPPKKGHTQVFHLSVMGIHIQVTLQERPRNCNSRSFYSVALTRQGVLTGKSAPPTRHHGMWPWLSKAE